MIVYLNNEEIQLQANQDLQMFLEKRQLFEQSGIAIALNNQVIPKVNWKTTSLKENDKLMIITATAGG